MSDDTPDVSVDHPPSDSPAFDEDGYCTVCHYGWWRHTCNHTVFCLSQVSG